MKEQEIQDFLVNSIEPIENDLYGKKYRASVILKGNITLPCVAFLDKQTYIDLAIRRFDESHKQPKKMISAFVTEQNMLNPNEIIRIEQCRNAMPLSLLQKIQDETLMSWTGFVLKMSDGNCFNFGTSFSFDFFDLPQNYAFSDVVEIINHSYVDKNGTLKRYRDSWKSAFENLETLTVYRELSHFNCYINSLF